ncbi:MAG: SDR family oxidoreductase [Alphaproteobacteria bacterium]|nr:SDR family oxidoreductase [Alphaproteobacteria bacterium]
MSALFNLEGQVAFLTGASRGLGVPMAKAIAAAGAHVVLAARDRSRLDAVAAEIHGAGHKASIEAFDLTDEDACIGAISNTVAEHGRLDILVTNAGMNIWSPLEEATIEDWHTVFDTNLTASYILCREASKTMIEKGYGRLVNVGSALSIIGREKVHAYVASKHGVGGLTRALAADVGPHGVTCNALLPGYFRTEINKDLLAREGFEDSVNGRIAMRRWGEPEELAGVVLFMASPASSYMNGHMIVVDGGLTETFTTPPDI